ncbi:MAG: galactose isomerase [Chloroflexi bacterium RBG_16_64_43]|nr:MAG: galactose isomerase [Chloroflexi bacterium RBG_16_64_43]
MRIALSADEFTPLVQSVRLDLERRGHQVEYLGPAAGQSADWPDVTRAAAERVAAGAADEAVVMCWTGTGASLAANKVPGIRAALCADAETARGARTWNHANVLALSLRSTSDPVAREILDAWFSTPYSQDEWNLSQVEKIRDMEKRRSG